MVVIFSGRYLAAETGQGKFYAMLLTMSAVMIGLACAADLFNLWLWFEAMAVSSYLLVTFYRDQPASLEAGVKYLILGALSTGVLVYGIAWIYGATGAMTFDGIATALTNPQISKPAALLGAAFLLAGLGFKVAAAPFQMWVPDVYQGAPIPVTTFLSVGSKAAGFIVLTRTVEAFMSKGSAIGAEIQGVLLIGGALTILLGSLPALFQTSVKRLLAYSSISHMGFMTLGIFALNGQGVQGAILQMFNHGITTGALFLFVGLIYERTHTRSIADYGGLMKAAPVYTIFLALFTLSSMALPGTNAFIGELLVLTGTFAANPGLAAAAVLGALLGAAYLLGMYRSVALGPARVARFRVWDVNARELAAILPLALFVLWVGLYPKPFLDIVQPSARNLLEQVHGAGDAPP